MLVMVLQVAHICPVLPAGIVRPGLSLRSVIHKVPDPVLPLALAPGQGAHQVPVVQDHCDQAPALALMLNLMLDPKCLQKAVVLVGQDTLALHHLM